MIKPPNDNTSKLVDKLNQFSEKGQLSGNFNSNLCVICSKRANSNQKFLTCKQCNHRIHFSGNDITSKEYPTFCAEPSVKN